MNQQTLKRCKVPKKETLNIIVKQHIYTQNELDLTLSDSTDINRDHGVGQGRATESHLLFCSDKTNFVAVQATPRGARPGQGYAQLRAFMMLC